MVVNNLLFGMLHVGMILAGILALAAKGSSNCADKAYGTCVGTMALILVIVPSIMILVHLGFFITYVIKGKIPIFEDKN